jgi:hypothetical protein
MSRESILRATVSALQPESLDLTQFAKARAASRERELRVRSDVAAGALAYAAMDQNLDADGKPLSANDPAGVRHPGDPLPLLLLRLKYAEQQSRALFDRAHLLLVHRHGGLDRRESETLHAVAWVALFEWVHDACPSCRGKRNAVKVSLCTGCRPDPETKERSAARRNTVGAVEFSPAPGCPKCKGLGRIFSAPKPSRGLKCLSCHSTGRKNLLPRRRAEMVAEYLTKRQRARREVPRGLNAKAFHEHWARTYYGFLDVLRAADRSMVAHVDLHEKPRSNRASVVAATREKQEDQRTDAPAVEESPTAESVQQPTGEFSPKES